MREEITIVKDGQTKVIELEDFPIFEERGWSRQEEQTSAPVANANWVHSNKLVSDAVYVKEGVVYFAYDISSLVGYPAFISYVANGLSPNKYSTNWGVSGDGENRVGPAISNTPPAGEIIEDPSLTMTGFTIGGEYASTANNSFSDFVFSGFEELKTSYPWLFDEVNGQTPGLTLLFEALALGTSVTAEQLSRAGLTTGYTQGQLDYLNAYYSYRRRRPFII